MAVTWDSGAHRNQQSALHRAENAGAGADLPCWASRLGGLPPAGGRRHARRQLRDALRGQSLVDGLQKPGRHKPHPLLLLLPNGHVGPACVVRGLLSHPLPRLARELGGLLGLEGVHHAVGGPVLRRNIPDPGTDAHLGPPQGLVVNGDTRRQRLLPRPVHLPHQHAPPRDRPRSGGLARGGRLGRGGGRLSIGLARGGRRPRGGGRLAGGRALSLTSGGLRRVQVRLEFSHES
mmetsp:Transcript_35169/g.78800  ORF Transcript_35169/g.78800 Transcript_35169/m.78800 type:complete len:234 (-) Transcript_35169:1368-2069(-)